MLALAPVVLLAFHLPNPVSSLPLLGGASSSLPLLSVYDAALSANPIATRIATAATFAAAGDAFSQRHLQTGHHKKYDVKRAAGLVGFDSFYRGVMQQPLLAWISATFDGRALRMLLPLLPLPLVAAFERVLVNQFIFGPGIYYPLYFSITGAIHGLTPRESFARAKAQWASLFGVNLLFWLPVQLVRLLTLPQRYWVPFICFAGLVWNVILSAVACRRDAECFCRKTGECSVTYNESPGSRFQADGRGVVVPTEGAGSEKPPARAEEAESV